MIDIEIFAPVVIPTLNRYEHLKKCLESLRGCTYADKTEVIISVDSPPSDKYRAGYEQICEYLDHFEGFAKLTVIKQVNNLGVVGNYEFLQDYVSRCYDRYIFTEDDNEFSPCFLDFMNQSLSYFKDDSSVTSVCGYTAQSYYGSSKENIIFTYDFSAWGYGTWVEKQEQYLKHGILYYHNLAISLKDSFEIFRTYPALLSMMLLMLSKETFWGDTIYSSYNIVNKTYQLRPSVSMVRNLGQDGSGAHSGIDESFIKQIIQGDKHFCLDEVSIHNALRETKKVNKRSFCLCLPKGKLHACYSILRIVFRWISYQFNHPDYK